jgi:ribonuclease III
MDQDRLEILHKLEKKLSYSFHDIGLLSTSLTHRSYVNENQQSGVSDNERFEFLGDSILGACVSDLIIKKYSGLSEGDLTKIRSVLVCEESLAEIARHLQMGDCLLIGRGEENAGSRNKESFLANALEAVVAALYLDSDYNNVKDIINELFKPLLEKDNLKTDYSDYKTALQELCQKKYKTTPMYMVVDSSGPEHAKVFEVRIVIINKLTEYGRGKSKKEAEKQAAQKALDILQHEES